MHHWIVHNICRSRRGTTLLANSVSTRMACSELSMAHTPFLYNLDNEEVSLLGLTQACCQHMLCPTGGINLYRRHATFCFRPSLALEHRELKESELGAVNFAGLGLEGTTYTCFKFRWFVV